MNRLAETVGITAAEAFIGNKDKDKERKRMKKAAVVGQKIANCVKGRKKSLRQVGPAEPFFTACTTVFSAAAEVFVHVLTAFRTRVQALVISDVRQCGCLDYDEFKSCLKSVGIILGDSDCQVLQ